MVGGEETDDVERATVVKEGGSSKDIKHRSWHRQQKAHGTFQRLRKVWAARGMGKRAKIHLFKRPVILYVCETWKITNNDERKLNSFQ